MLGILPCECGSDKIRKELGRYLNVSDSILCPSFGLQTAKWCGLSETLG